MAALATKRCITYQLDYSFNLSSRNKNKTKVIALILVCWSFSATEDASNLDQKFFSLQIKFLVAKEVEFFYLSERVSNTISVNGQRWMSLK